MNDREFEEPSAALGLFHTLVVMGSALALGCGGASRYTQEAPDGTSGIGAANASGGTASGGGGTLGGSGGSVATTGGASSSSGGTGGVIAIGGGSATGGSAGTGGNIVVGSAGKAPLPDCVPAQWSCSNIQCDPAGIVDSYDCTCDPTRPKSAADCAADQTVACLTGYMTTAANTEVYSGFQCSCVPKEDCATACQAVDGGPFKRCIEDQANGDPILCGCAPILLK